MRKILINFYSTVMTFLIVFVVGFASANAYAASDEEATEALQQITVTGTVVDENGDPMPGVNIIVKGTTTGTFTDVDGKYKLSVPNTDAVLEFTFIGYATQEVKIGKQSVVNVSMKATSTALDEIVVIGYGTQSKKDITGAVSVVSTDALTESAAVTFAEALQGKSAGVYVSTTGAPGSSSRIRIRGIGSVNNSDPLVIIDGVSGGDVSSVPANDIESFQVLKDASATAIYGAQGANGVIIVTTKQGTKSGQARVSYNGYVGVGQMANDGYDLLNAWESMEFVAEGMRNLHNYQGGSPAAHAQFGSLLDYTENNGKWSGGHLTMPYSLKPAGYSEEQIIAEFGSIEAWEQAYAPTGQNAFTRSAYAQMLLDGYSEKEARKGTDWYSLIVQNGLIMNHQLSVIGGNDKGKYSMSVGYTSHEGTTKASYFDRYSIRANTTFFPRKYITIGQNSSAALTEFQGDRGGQSDASIFGQTYTIQPWVPVYNIGGNFAGSTSTQGGRTVSAVATTERFKGDWRRYLRLQNSLFAEINPIPELTIKSQFATNIRTSWSRNFNEINIYDNKEGSATNSFSENAQYALNWQWTNTATYAKTFGDHGLTVVIGSEALNNNIGENISATRINYTSETDQNSWTLNNGGSANQSNGGYYLNHYSMFGYFGRADYNFKGKYLATVTVRRDASSKFGKNNRWGTFPSISAGWRISDESFMSGTSSWLDDLKIRAGYGSTGNSSIGEYNWAFQYATGNSFLYAVDGSNNNAATGYHISALGDAGAKWETTTMLNAGFDATAINNKLSVTFDYYVKKTVDMLVSASWSALAGNASKPKVNIGDMKNIGFDATISWKDKVGKFSYGLTANLSQYKNEIIKLGSANIFNGTRITDLTITTIGQPIGMFYGYNVLGIYTSEEDVMNYKSSQGSTVIPYGADDIGSDKNPAINYVGRYKFEDTDGNGKITSADRKIIGNPHPDLTGGLNIQLGYGNWDLSSYLYFSIGNDIYAHYKYYTHFGSLQSTYSHDRADHSWSPDNPNGRYPLWVTGDAEAAETTSTSNSIYIEDGSYARMQNLTLGYNLPKSAMNKIGISKLRVYGQISNVFTITKYPGLDPEILGSSDMMRGIDFGAYGIPRQFMFGINVTF